MTSTRETAARVAVEIADLVGFDPTVQNAAGRRVEDIVDEVLRDEAEPKLTWKLIDSAPKDGAAILLANCDAQDRYAMQGFWDRDPETEGGSCWRLSGYDTERAEPTHWMPLPDPPAIRNDKGE